MYKNHKTNPEKWKLTVVLDYYEAMETCSRIGLLRSYGNLQSYFRAALTILSDLATEAAKPDCSFKMSKLKPTVLDILKNNEAWG